MTVSILNGNFDPDLISSKLQAQGHEVKEHEGHPYYSEGEDYVFRSYTVLSTGTMNRVMATERTLIAASATQPFILALDTRAGSFPSLRDNPAYLAIATSMGSVLAGAIHRRGFGGTADYVGTGYRFDGTDLFLVISLLYRDTAEAEQKAARITKAMKEYVRPESTQPLGDKFSAVSSRVDVYVVGSILTIEAELKDTPRSGIIWDMLEGRGLQFLRE